MQRASRAIEDLRTTTASKARSFLEAAEFSGREVLITCTFRPLIIQARLYRNGRRFADIEAKANELDATWNRPDLAELLMDVGPQHGRRKLTNAGPGQSTHNYRGAFDFVPIVDGKPFWSNQTAEDVALWAALGKIGMGCGLEWAGTWMRFREFPHLEEPGVNWRELISKAGAGDGAMGTGPDSARDHLSDPGGSHGLAR